MPKTTIRQGVFETNSSSTHSLAITNKEHILTHDEMYESLKANFNQYDEYAYNKNTRYYFGRYPFQVIASFDEKFRYALANSCYNVRNLAKVLTAVTNLVPEFRMLDFKIFQEIGCDDHSLFDWLESNNITLEEFFTNEKYTVICEGDEYCYYRHMAKMGIITDKNYEV